MSATDDVTCVLFDLDGTLIDSIPGVLAAYRHAFETAGLAFPSTPEDERWVVAARPREAFAAKAGDAAVDACEAAYAEHYLRHATQLVTAYAGARELLDELSGRGIAIGLVTNKARVRLAPDLRSAGLDDLALAAVVTAEDSAERKPHPRPVQLGLERAGSAPERTLYVGDGPHDVEAAHAAGVRAVGCTYGYYGRERLAATSPEALIDAPGELLELLGVAEARR